MVGESTIFDPVEVKISWATKRLGVANVLSLLEIFPFQNCNTCLLLNRVHLL